MIYWYLPCIFRFISFSFLFCSFHLQYLTPPNTTVNIKMITNPTIMIMKVIELFFLWLPSFCPALLSFFLTWELSVSIKSESILNILVTQSWTDFSISTDSAGPFLNQARTSISHFCFTSVLHSSRLDLPLNSWEQKVLT